jgi:hypothetical protein
MYFVSNELLYGQGGHREGQAHVRGALASGEPEDDRGHRELHISPELANYLIQA